MKVSHRPLFILLLLSLILSGCSFFSPKEQSKPQDSSAQAQPEAPQPEAVGKVDAMPSDRDSRYSNIWDRIRSGYGLPTVSDSRLGNPARWYANKQSYINRFAGQAEPYLYYVVSEMEANGLPLELAFIPIIESSYNPHVISPSNTAGIWQFIPETGRNFGLKQNSWYNGRKDVIASTDAAIRYLKKLHDNFNSDWLLVVAAYNAGEGNISRAIERNRRAGKATDFWSLQLPKHTQDYIPQLLILAKVIANPSAHNVSLPAIANTPYFVKVNVSKQVNIAQVAKQANMDANELKKLNSGLNGWLTSPGGQQLLVPVADAGEFTAQLNTMPTLAAIATDAEETAADKKSTASGKKPKQARNESSAYYTVKSGENLWSIAKAQKISVKALAKLNEISLNAVLKPGQKLLLLSQATPN
ncbi:MAG TPA: transglycosylase SLT domain-containing protein [Cellvibrio sp.]|nr:transglycosylase SLT domain-containing protein [Cellvibrio sp.]